MFSFRRLLCRRYGFVSSLSPFVSVLFPSPLFCSHDLLGVHRRLLLSWIVVGEQRPWGRKSWKRIYEACLGYLTNLNPKSHKLVINESLKTRDSHEICARHRNFKTCSGGGVNKQRNVAVWHGFVRWDNNSLLHVNLVVSRLSHHIESLQQSCRQVKFFVSDGYRPSHDNYSDSQQSSCWITA